MRVYLPDNLRASAEARARLAASAREVLRRFPDGVPLLRAEEDMKVDSKRFRSLDGKIKRLEEMKATHPLRRDPDLPRLKASHARRRELAFAARAAKANSRRLACEAFNLGKSGSRRNGCVAFISSSRLILPSSDRNRFESTFMSSSARSSGTPSGNRRSTSRALAANRARASADALRLSGR